jgi:DNA-binding transcriptional ArsR family regulator
VAVPADHVFTALADATRRGVIESLATHGECTATELAAGMPITRQAVAKHLSVLHRGGLVRPERRGRETLYHLTPQPFAHAIDWLEDVAGAAARRRRAAA